MPEHQQIQQSKKTNTIFQKQATPVSQTPVSNPYSIIQRARINPKSLTHADIMQLQRTIGNQAVGRLLSSIGNTSTAQQATVQRQETPEEKTCPSCMQRQEIPEGEETLQGRFKEPIQRQEIPEEEEPLQGKMIDTIQRQEIPEEEEPLQGKMIETIQRQEIPEEEEPLQSKMIETVQRQEIPEEEEPLQGKFETIQRQEIPEDEEPLQGKIAETVQRQEMPKEEEPLQGKFENKPEIACTSCFASPMVQRQEIPEVEESLQGKMIETVQKQKVQEEEPLQIKRENNTGMPDNLKAGVESLSGIDMSDVKVHYNSSKPAEVGALAFTQGKDIYVAPGQEQNLPHEAWHVVQQKQGFVEPTMQLKEGVLVNDEARLEHEADAMGCKSAEMKVNSAPSRISNDQEVMEREENHANVPDNLKVGVKNETKNNVKQLSLEHNSEKSIDQKDHIETHGLKTSTRCIVIQRFCGHPDCKDPECHDRSKHSPLTVQEPPTVQDAMEGISPLQEILYSMKTADERYRYQAESSPGGEHLHQSAHVKDHKRRQAEIKTPVDRLVLSAEHRSLDFLPDQKGSDVHYIQLTQITGSGEPLIIGRSQDPKGEKQPLERHIYHKGYSSPPSYPYEAGQLGKMVKSQQMSDQKVFAMVGDTMLVNPKPMEIDEEQWRSMATVSDVIGIAEQRRDPAMAFTSAQTIDFASSPDSKMTLTDVFGRRKGKENQPGLLPASGTGAAKEFREFREKILESEEPTSESGERLFKNIVNQHTLLMQQGFNPEGAQRLHDDGVDRDFILETQRARMRSAATRLPAMMTGQLLYRLRPLRESTFGSSHLLKMDKEQMRREYRELERRRRVRGFFMLKWKRRFLERKRRFLEKKRG